MCKQLLLNLAHLQISRVLFLLAARSPRASTSQSSPSSRHVRLAIESNALCAVLTRSCAFAEVESQIKVRDFSRAEVSITPAEFGSWDEARSELLKEAKRPLKAQLDAELATAADDAAVKECRDAFAQREAAIEHDIDHEPLEMHLQLGVAYNFLSK